MIECVFSVLQRGSRVAPDNCCFPFLSLSLQLLFVLRRCLILPVVCSSSSCCCFKCVCCCFAEMSGKRARNPTKKSLESLASSSSSSPPTRIPAPGARVSGLHSSGRSRPSTTAAPVVAPATSRLPVLGGPTSPHLRDGFWSEQWRDSYPTFSVVANTVINAEAGHYAMCVCRCSSRPFAFTRSRAKKHCAGDVHRRWVESHPQEALALTLESPAFFGPETSGLSAASPVSDGDLVSPGVGDRTLTPGSDVRELPASPFGRSRSPRRSTGGTGSSRDADFRSPRARSGKHRRRSRSRPSRSSGSRRRRRSRSLSRSSGRSRDDSRSGHRRRRRSGKGRRSSGKRHSHKRRHRRSSSRSDSTSGTASSTPSHRSSGDAATVCILLI